MRGELSMQEEAAVLDSHGRDDLSHFLTHKWLGL